MKLDIGYCSACRRETRREPGEPQHWWHVGVKPMLNCLWKMVESSEYRPEFVLVEADVDTIKARLPRQRTKANEAVRIRV